MATVPDPPRCCQTPSPGVSLTLCLVSPLGNLQKPHGGLGCRNHPVGVGTRQDCLAGKFWVLWELDLSAAGSRREAGKAEEHPRALLLGKGGPRAGLAQRGGKQGLQGLF